MFTCLQQRPVCAFMLLVAVVLSLVIPPLSPAGVRAAATRLHFASLQLAQGGTVNPGQPVTVRAELVYAGTGQANQLAADMQVTLVIRDPGHKTHQVAMTSQPVEGVRQQWRVQITPDQQGNWSLTAVAHEGQHTTQQSFTFYAGNQNRASLPWMRLWQITAASLVLLVLGAGWIWSLARKG